MHFVADSSTLEVEQSFVVHAFRCCLEIVDTFLKKMLRLGLGQIQIICRVENAQRMEEVQKGKRAEDIT